MNKIEFLNVSKSYDQINNVIDHLDLSIQSGEFVILVGASGCGKTSLLRTINKLNEIDEGDILVDGKSIKDWDDIYLRRHIGYVIQKIGLMPHMTVEENIDYVLTLEKINKEEKLRTAHELISLVELDKSYLQKYPDQLSGGEQQRIGVARALAFKPEIVLMDEPFGAVDEITRSVLQDEIKRIQKQLNLTIIFVTHDIEEALKLGDKIVLMKNGKIEQQGTPEELVYHPESQYVKDFFGLKGFKAIMKDKEAEELYEKYKEKY